MEHETVIDQQTAPGPFSRAEVSRAFDMVGEVLDTLRAGSNAVPLSEREPCELLVTYARANLSTAHSLLCAALCDVKQDWRR